MSAISAKSPGVYLIGLFGFVLPLLLWLKPGPAYSYFGNYYQSLSTLGKAAGLVGLALLALNAIIAGRYRLIDRLFQGLDKAYAVHGLLGKLATVLLLLHAALLGLRLLAFSFSDFFGFFLSANNWPLLLGKISLSGLLAIVAVTLYAKWRYERKMRIHRILVFFLLLGGLHAFFISSDISANLWLRSYFILIVSAGLLSFAWRNLGSARMVKKTGLSVASVRQAAKGITEIVFNALPEKKFEFLPGQFVFIEFRQAGIPPETHPFSLTSAPGNSLSLAVKSLGDFTAGLDRLKPGAKAFVQGPFGGFSYLKTKNRRQFWIAGGIGITPFLSMARDLDSGRGRGFKISLLHLAKTHEEAVYRDELEKISSRTPGFKYRVWDSNAKGRLDAAQALRYMDIEDARERDIFLCGPPGLVSLLRSEFKSLGLGSKQIHFEYFNLGG